MKIQTRVQLLSVLFTVFGEAGVVFRGVHSLYLVLQPALAGALPAADWMGVPFGLVKGEWMTPIGRILSSFILAFAATGFAAPIPGSQF